MLAHLPLPYLVLMAAVATLALCLYVESWLKLRKLTVTFLVLSPLCCLGMIVVGGLQHQHWTPQQMLVIYSFAWIGILIGLLPSRGIVRKYQAEWRRGVKREKYEYPKHCLIAPAASIALMSILGYALAT
ncbi:hypothetical protein ACFVFQ_30700 [Streptomyces sp. NPDC057743]|uniref:hypothetical protein n=1 Tax=Streptomyces sp. NPDC057743 TaxID=3346236 RepID=UPI0036C725C0